MTPTTAATASPAATRPATESVRQCAGCGGRASPDELIRLVAGLDGRVYPDIDHRAPGRGVHVGPALACIEAAIKRKRLGAVLRAQVVAPDPASLYAEIEKQVTARLRQLIHKARSIGALALGAAAVDAAREAGTLAGAVIAHDLSPNTANDLIYRLERDHAPWQALGTKAGLSALCGAGSDTGALAVLRDGPARRILALFAVWNAIEGGAPPACQARAAHLLASGSRDRRTHRSTPPASPAGTPT